MSESDSPTSSAADDGSGASPELFNDALKERLAAYSVRGLADKAHWGRTVVSDIKSGRQLPTSKQLQDLLRAVGADDDELAEWEERRQLASASRASEPVIVDSPPPPPPAVVPASPRSPRRLLVAGLVVTVGLLVLVVVIITRLATSTPQSLPLESKSPPTVTPSVASPIPTVPTTPNVGGAISSPLDGTRVSSTRGVQLSGTVQTQGPETVWLVDQDSDGTYTADTTVDRSSDGAWAAEDVPIGDPSDVPSRITILLVQANDTCAAFLRKEVDADDSTFETLPRGCEVLDTVTVTVDRR